MDSLMFADDVRVEQATRYRNAVTGKFKKKPAEISPLALYLQSFSYKTR